MGLAVRLFRICGNATASAPFPSHRLVTKLYDCRSFRQCSKEGKYSCHRTLTGSWISWLSSCGFLKPDSMTKSTASRNTLYRVPEIVTRGDSQMEASQIQHGGPRRLVMSAPTPLRQDFDAPQVRGLARKTKDGPQARRLLALAAIYDGATRTEAAKIGGVGLQIIRDWVLRFNARGPDGLLDGKSTGQPSKLNDTQRQAIAGMIESGPIPAVHGVVRWRLIDLAQWIFEEFRIRIAKQTLSRELRAMGYRKLSARPRHHAQAAGAIEGF